MSKGVERYEADIVDRFRGYEKAGKGQVIELCQIQVGDRQLSFVAFRTGGDMVVTARHHVNEFFGTTETVMRLAQSGQEGFTLVPVVDVAYYGESQERRERIMQGGSLCSDVHDLFFGYKDGPPSNAKNDWADYKYTQSDPPPAIAAIKTLIDDCLVVVDLHNSATSAPFFLTVPTLSSDEIGIFELVTRQMMDRGESVQSYQTSAICGRQLVNGVYEYRGRPHTIINYARTAGVMNLGFEIPVFDPSVGQGKWPQLRNIEDSADVTSGVIIALARSVNR